jgi:Leucine-rich repeat (LRR) protein
MTFIRLSQFTDKTRETIQAYDEVSIDRPFLQDLEDLFVSATHVRRLSINSFSGKRLPPIASMRYLEELEIYRGNYLLTLPADIGELKNLKVFKMHTTRSCVLPPLFGKLKNLEELSLDGVSDDGNLTAILSGLTALKKLRIQALAGTTLSLPHANPLPVEELEVVNCEELVQLDILKNMPRLKKLTLFRNPKLYSFPASMHALKQLQDLRIEVEQLQGIPDVIGELTNLEKVYLTSQKWQGDKAPDAFVISPAIGKLHKLRELSLEPQYWNLPAVQIPETIGELTQLEQLNVYCLPLGPLPGSLGKLHKLQKLELRWCQLTALPPQIGELQGLEHLNLEHNQFNTLPAQIGLLKNLRKLILNRNPLTLLPDETGDCENLEVLEVDNMDAETKADERLTRIPEGIGKLSKLISLKINGIFTELPESIGELQHLHTLDLSGSPNLRYLPESISTCVNLREISVRGTEIRQLPTALFKLENLFTVTTNPVDMQFSPRKLDADFFYCLYPQRRYGKLNEPMPDEKRRIYLHIYLNNFRQEQLESMPQQILFDGLTTDYEPLRQALLENVFVFNKDRQSLADKPLQAGDVVTMLGTTNYKKTELKTRLTSLGIEYSSSLTEKVTHVLVGYPPKSGTVIPAKTFFLCNEKELTDFFNRVDTPYLLSEEGRAEDLTANLLQLLHHPDSANEALALQMLEGAGVPPELLPDLLVISKISDEPGNRSKARQLLKKNTTDATLLRAMAHKEHLSDKKARYHDSTYFHLLHYQREFPSLNTSAMAFLIWLKKENSAGEYFMQFSPENDQRRKVYIDRNFPKWLTRPTTLIVKEALMASEVNTLLRSGTVPTEKIEMLRLTGVHLTSLPEEILSLPVLKELDITASRLKEIPESIRQLQNLRQLQVMSDNLQKLPLSLAELPLRSISIKSRRTENVAALQNLMPQCRFYFNSKY